MNSTRLRMPSGSIKAARISRSDATEPMFILNSEMWAIGDAVKLLADGQIVFGNSQEVSIVCEYHAPELCRTIEEPLIFPIACTVFLGR